MEDHTEMDDGFKEMRLSLTSCFYLVTQHRIGITQMNTQLIGIGSSRVFVPLNQPCRAEKDRISKYLLHSNIYIIIYESPVSNL